MEYLVGCDSEPSRQRRTRAKILRHKNSVSVYLYSTRIQLEYNRAGYETHFTSCEPSDASFVERRLRYQPVNPQTSNLPSRPAPTSSSNVFSIDSLTNGNPSSSDTRSETSTAKYGVRFRNKYCRFLDGLASSARGRWKIAATSSFDAVRLIVVRSTEERGRSSFLDARSAFACTKPCRRLD